MTEPIVVDTLPGSEQCQMQIMSAMSIIFEFPKGEHMSVFYSLEAFISELVLAKPHKENLFQAEVLRSELTDPRRDMCVKVLLHGRPFLFSRMDILSALLEAQFLYSTVR